MAVQTFTLANLTDISAAIQTFATGSSGTMTSSGLALVSTGASFTLTLPSTAQISTGQIVTVKSTTTSGAITLVSPSGLIDNLSSWVVAGGARGHNTLQWDGANWWVVG